MMITEAQSTNPSKIRLKEEEDTDEPPEQPPDMMRKNGNSDTIYSNNRIDFDVENINGYAGMISSGNFKEETFDIIFYDQYKDNKMVFQQEKCLINENNEIMLANLMERLKKNGMNFKGALISYFDSIADLYVFCGKDPLNDKCTVPYSTIVGKSLEIKVRTKKKNLVELLLEEQKKKEEKEDDSLPPGKQFTNNAQKNRVKERKIGQVVEKVALWRRFYTGYFDEKQQFTSMPLEIAAKEVDISKKTLDDYLLQIRCGKKYGFDFNKNLDKRIGELRGFVKKEKNKEKSSKSKQ